MDYLSPRTTINGAGLKLLRGNIINQNIAVLHARDIYVTQLRKSSHSKRTDLAKNNLAASRRA